MKRGSLVTVLSALLLVGVQMTFTSCMSQKRLAYFQSDTLRYSTQTIENTYTPLIQTDDLLAIRVSSLNADADMVFNAPSIPVGNMSTASGYAPGANLQQPIGFLVDKRGFIQVPLAGDVKVAGLTMLEASAALKEKLQLYLREPMVSLRFINYKVSVLGEVAKPSIYTIPNEKITLPEALSLAGDMTIYGRRDNVLIIRENAGVREFTRVNLNDRNVFKSSNYYLRNNDVVYIEPVKTRAVQTDRAYVMVPLFSGIISALAIFVTAFRR